MKTQLLLLLVVCIGFSCGSTNTPQCGTIYDGLTSGKFDIQYQSSRTTVGANWFDFGPNILAYEWAIFSDSFESSIQRSTGCVRQIQITPDIQTWINVQKNTHAVNTKLNLKGDRKYYTAVRAIHSSGIQFIAFSDGFKVISGDNLFTHNQENVQQTKPTENIRNVPDFSSTCPIDDFNRCRSGQISVADRLRELYGDAKFPAAFGTAGFIFGDNQDNNNNDDDDDGGGDDDDNGSHIWVLAPILGVILLAICLVLLCLLLLLFCCSKSISLPERERKEKPAKVKNAPMEFENVQEQKEYGVRDGVGGVDASTHTVVEFPDTNIRRLSISHNDNPLEADEESVGRNPRNRGAHPIMSSASSSFRDYRSSVNHG